MNEWRCTVKTPSNFLQDVYVDAYTRADAVAAAEHSTGGKCINAVPEYDISSSVNNNDNESESSMDGGFILIVALVVFLVYAWKWILLIGAIALFIWGIIQFSKD